jgi:hypothetical protein
VATLDPEPLVQTFEEAQAHWRKGIKAQVVFDLAIPTGREPEIKQATRLPPGLNDDLPF